MPSHTARQPWRAESINEDKDNEGVKQKLIIRRVRALLNKITFGSESGLTEEFFSYRVYDSVALEEVVSIIYDKAVDEPRYRELYARLCFKQVQEELRESPGVSNFRNALLLRAQETFTTKNAAEEAIDELEREEEDSDSEERRQQRNELLEALNKFRRRKFGNVKFLGHLYLQNLISMRIILFCVVDSLKSVTERPADVVGYRADDDAIECVVRLLETVGRRIEENAQAPAAPYVPAFPLDQTMRTLEEAKPIVSSRIRFLIMNLLELRANRWEPRRAANEMAILI